MRSLLVFPCSETKRLAKEVQKQSFSAEETESFVDSLSPSRRKSIAGARDSLNTEFSDDLLFALDRYNGHLYRAPNLRETIALRIRKKLGGVLIISGAYGAVTPSELIQYYRRYLDSELLEYWLNNGLPEAIAEYAASRKSEVLLGFFRRIDTTGLTNYEKLFDALVSRTTIDAWKCMALSRSDDFESYYDLGKACVNILGQDRLVAQESSVGSHRMILQQIR